MGIRENAALNAKTPSSLMKKTNDAALHHLENKYRVAVYRDPSTGWPPE
jgi:hypothetical protein